MIRDIAHNHLEVAIDLYLDSKDVNGKGCNGLYGEILCDDNGFCSTHMIKIVSKYNE